MRQLLNGQLRRDSVRAVARSLGEQGLFNDAPRRLLRRSAPPSNRDSDVNDLATINILTKDLKLNDTGRCVDQISDDDDICSVHGLAAKADELLLAERYCTDELALAERYNSDEECEYRISNQT